MYIVSHAPNGEQFQQKAAFMDFESAARYMTIQLVNEGIDPVNTPSLEDLHNTMVKESGSVYALGVNTGRWRIKKIIPLTDNYEMEYERVVEVHKEDLMKKRQQDFMKDLESMWVAFNNHGGTVDMFNNILEHSKINRQ